MAAVFRSRCGSCHNPDKQKGGLNLDNYGSAMQGGGSGKVIEPGDAENSTLFLVISHKEEPKMPPNSPKIPDAEIELIRKWIEGGALENSGSVVTAKAKPKFEFKLDPAAMGKPAGTPAMPENLTTEPFVPAGQAQRGRGDGGEPLGASGRGRRPQAGAALPNDRLPPGRVSCPFPRGRSTSSSSAATATCSWPAAAAAGSPGSRSPGTSRRGRGSSRSARSTTSCWRPTSAPTTARSCWAGPARSSGSTTRPTARSRPEMRKHTEWITAAEFSPDGVLLATGDRNNGLIVWEAQTGREFYDLRGHQAAITDVSWRLDSNVLASASEDGDGQALGDGERRQHQEHSAPTAAASASVRFAKDGRLVTTGRDRLVRLWDQNGGKQREFEPFGDLALEAVITHDESQVIAADWTGEIRVWDIKDGRRLANLAVNPAPLPSRIEQAKRTLAAVQAEADSLSKQLVPLQNAIAPANAALTQAQAKVTAAEQAAAKQTDARSAARAGAQGQAGRGR